MVGLLNIRKPYDITSRDVVNRVPALVRPHDAGQVSTSTHTYPGTRQQQTEF
ncbi:MAG: hypothetical protein ACYC3X_28530 [Pirellulaceae bacterium]